MTPHSLSSAFLLRVPLFSDSVYKCETGDHRSPIFITPKKSMKKGDRFIFQSSATLKVSKNAGSKYAKNGAYCFTELPAPRSTTVP